MKKYWKRSAASAFMTALVLAFSFGVYAYDGRELIPMGQTTGIKLYAKGAVVIGLPEGQSPAKEAGLQAGDLILAVNNQPVTSNADLQKALEGQADREVLVTVQREGEEKQYRITACRDGACDKGRLGAWVRDSMAGIGTITFVDPENGEFGALGHGICDSDTGELMPMGAGSTMRSSVTDVTKGRCGEPGMLGGSYDLEHDSGVIRSNTDAGIFGRLTDGAIYQGRKALPVAEPGEIRTGGAAILSNVQGDQVETYKIRIVKLYNGENGNRDMMLQVTDPRLLERTGGIVQGMSGSPIIQNGKLVGAVTHVLVNDPTRGYGIFVENMLETAENTK